MAAIAHKRIRKSTDIQNATRRVNSPDLYIPVMAFVTFVLVCGYLFGTAGRFTPELLIELGSRSGAALLLEVLIMYVGFYLLETNGLTPRIWDLVAYSGYKYVGMLVSVMVGIFLYGGWPYAGAKLFTGASTAFFMMRTMKRALAPPVDMHPSQADQAKHSAMRRNYFILLLGATQLGLTWFLLRMVPIS